MLTGRGRVSKTGEEGKVKSRPVLETLVVETNPREVEGRRGRALAILTSEEDAKCEDRGYVKSDAGVGHSDDEGADDEGEDGVELDKSILSASSLRASPLLLGEGAPSTLFPLPAAIFRGDFFCL